MQSSRIEIQVTLDQQRIPESISWQASDTPVSDPHAAKAMLLSFWDQQSATSLQMDLWTKEMRMDEMADFLYQTMMGMADSFERATHLTQLSTQLKSFARQFIEEFAHTQQQLSSNS
ncbi:MAG: gliding motility protein GldC [Thermoflavifilum sp.]|nr:gliding motility protein GldC [Thermoflavifilum sp.]